MPLSLIRVVYGTNRPNTHCMVHRLLLVLMLLFGSDKWKSAGHHVYTFVT